MAPNVVKLGLGSAIGASGIPTVVRRNARADNVKIGFKAMRMMI